MIFGLTSREIKMEKTHSSPETMSKGCSIKSKRQATFSKYFFHLPQNIRKEALMPEYDTCSRPGKGDQCQQRAFL